MILSQNKKITLFAIFLPNQDIKHGTTSNFFLTKNYAVINVGNDIYYTDLVDLVSNLKEAEDNTSSIDFNYVETT